MAGTGFNIGNSSITAWANKVTIPWQNLSRLLYPRTMEQVFAWAEELWNHHGLYSQAIKSYSLLHDRNRGLRGRCRLRSS